MIFLFPDDDRHGIVMRDMNFPIDIIWLYHGTIVDVAPNVQTENVGEEDLVVYYPRDNANVVLELPAGWAKQNDVKIGDALKVVE